MKLKILNCIQFLHFRISLVESNPPLTMNETSLKNDRKGGVESARFLSLGVFALVFGCTRPDYSLPVLCFQFCHTPTQPNKIIVYYKLFQSISV